MKPSYNQSSVEAKEIENEIPALITRISESIGTIEFRLDELAAKLSQVLSQSQDDEPRKCEEEASTVIGSKLQNIATRLSTIERSIPDLIERIAL